MQGQFVWYELFARDLDAARSFYADVLGWSVVPAEIPGMDYHIVLADRQPIGGMFPVQGECAGPNGGGWIAYIAVDDVEGMVSRITALGGVVHMQPDDIPGVGRFAVVGDPKGAPFVIFKAFDPTIHQLPEQMKPGHVAWNELSVGDWQQAFGFYESLFGWSKAEAMDMGPMGTYQMFSTSPGRTVGAMMNQPDGGGFGWLFYFGVEDIDAAIERVKRAKGQLKSEPMAIPGDCWVVEGLDPQGGRFAMVGPRAAA